MVSRFLILCCVVLSCNTVQEERDLPDGADSSVSSSGQLVKVAYSERKTFVSQVITNGKILGNNEIDLSFPVPGIMGKLYIRNGDLVQKGQLIAALDFSQQQLAVREAQLMLDESRVEVSDQLISQGGKRGDTTSVRPDIYAYIKLRSGYNRALLALKKAELDVSRTQLYAPTTGIIANLSVSEFSRITSDKPICLLLDRSLVLSRCSILETELGNVQIGQTAIVEPLAGSRRRYKGIVTNINPIVSTQGLVDVTVRVTDPDQALLTGMNVRIIIEKAHPHQLVVPKRAVVERGGRQVVFTYVKGLAKWNYVRTAQENDKELTISDGLSGGELVIISGNVNLGHDARVKITDEHEID